MRPDHAPALVARNAACLCRLWLGIRILLVLGAVVGLVIKLIRVMSVRYGLMPNGKIFMVSVLMLAENHERQHRNIPLP